MNGLYEELQPALHNQETIIDCIKDGAAVYALTGQTGDSKYGDLFVVFEQKAERVWERSYENDFLELKPWKIELGDIDGNGEQEILIAVHKTTHFDPIEKNRMFIFNYSEGKLRKKWTGSQIAGVWKDFYVGDMLSIPGNELIFIEQMEDQRERISIYYWFDFGFVLLAESEPYNNIHDLAVIGENRLQITSGVGVREQIKTLTVKNGKIIEFVSKP